MITVLLFTALMGAAFGLLQVTQERYQTESQVLDSFQDARLALDQMVRDITAAGFPPANHFSGTPLFTAYASSPFAWSPSYPATPCIVGACATPGDFDLIVETDSGSGVQWIRYQLQGTTLYRGVAAKADGVDPADATAPNLVPYIQNVMNNASAAQIAQFQGPYPAMFPGGNPVLLFYYDFEPGSSLNTPPNISSVNVTLIMMAAQPDVHTGLPRLVELNGRGNRINPSN
jgi:Tfp pilus assembly protein PilW